MFVCALASQIKTQAQEDPYCYMVDGSGRQQNLNSLCGSRRNVNTDNNPKVDHEKIKLLMPLVDKGREYMRAGQYQDAISMFTQAVNEYPDFAGAYMGRAYSKHMLRMNLDSVIEDFRNAANAYGRRGEADMVNNVSRLIQRYRREKLGIVE